MKKELRKLYEDHKGKVSDKWSGYLAEYDRIFGEYRDRHIQFMEIGIQNGGSLEIWSKYFCNAQKLIGCDINPECAKLSYYDSRIEVVVGDANSNEVQAAVLAHAPSLDVIIDDGSHRSSDIVKSFARYFQYLADGGVYVAEDLHCTYWKEFEGGLYDPYSSITFFKHLADIANHEHWGIGKAPSDLLGGFFAMYGFKMDDEVLQHIHSVEFINSMCVIRKSKPELNKIGARFIAGTVEQVVTGHLGLHSTSNTVLDQLGNEWADRQLPPHEELLLRIRELAERDAQIASLSQAVNDKDACINNLHQVAAQNVREISSLSYAVFAREAQIIRFQNSASWRITRPLRMLGQQIKRITHSTGFDTPVVHLNNGNVSSAGQLVPVPTSTFKLDLWRPAQSRFQMICGSLNIEGRGVEVGPSYNPILPKKQGYSVVVVDHMSADDLRAKYKAWNVDTSAIEEVDIIWKGGAFAEAFDKQDRFDYIVASHVIEHIPDPIRFLQECEKILEPNGKVSLVVPDKRYCFDFYRTLTTTGEWVEAYLEKHTVHPPRKHFDNFAYAVTKGDAIAWGKGANGEITLQDHTLKDAMNHAEKQHLSWEYQDVHGWQFTPESFCLVLRELRDLGLVNWSILTSYPTHGFEFYVTLERASEQTAAALTKADRQALVHSSLNPHVEEDV